MRVLPACQVKHGDIRGLAVVERPVAIRLLPVIVVVGACHDFEVVVFEARPQRQRASASTPGYLADPGCRLFGLRKLTERPRRLLNPLESAAIANLIQPGVVESAAIQDRGPEG